MNRCSPGYEPGGIGLAILPRYRCYFGIDCKYYDNEYVASKHIVGALPSVPRPVLSVSVREYPRDSTPARDRCARGTVAIRASVGATASLTDMNRPAVRRRSAARPATIDADGTPIAIGEFTAAAWTPIRNPHGCESSIPPVNGSVHVNTSFIDV